MARYVDGFVVPVPKKNVAAYVVIDGVRSNLAKVPIDLPEDAWHELRVIMEGTTLRCLLDDEPVLTVEDDKLGEAGAIGLWTKADAATLFDDLSVGPP